jgi:hypothetical protein
VFKRGSQSREVIALFNRLLEETRQCTGVSPVVHEIPAQGAHPTAEGLVLWLSRLEAAIRPAM